MLIILNIRANQPGKAPAPGSIKQKQVVTAAKKVAGVLKGLGYTVGASQVGICEDDESGCINYPFAV